MSSRVYERIVELLEELVRLYKIVNKPAVVQRLEEELADERRRRIYELSDGERSARDVADALGISHVTVTRYWRQWAQKGLVIPAERPRGRYKFAVDLEEYGLSSEEEKE